MSEKTRLTLEIMIDSFAICRMAPNSTVPDWVDQKPWVSVTRTDEELSIVCRESLVPGDVQTDTGWRMLKLQGPFPFDLVGVLSSVLNPLAEKGVSIFAVSTFDTDYLMVKGDKLELACSVLTEAGHLVKER